MKSKERILTLVALVIAGLVALALVTSQSASAARPFSERSLTGAYHFSVSEITVDGPMGLVPPFYCSQYGIIVFDGDGFAAIESDDPEEQYGICYDSLGTIAGEDVPPEPGCFTYSVDPDGSVIITEVDSHPWCVDPDPPSAGFTTHCRILDKGELLVCDGTGGVGGLVPPGRLLWSATAGKL